MCLVRSRFGWCSPQDELDIQNEFSQFIKKIENSAFIYFPKEKKKISIEYSVFSPLRKITVNVLDVVGGGQKTQRKKKKKLSSLNAVKKKKKIWFNTFLKSLNKITGLSNIKNFLF